VFIDDTQAKGRTLLRDVWEQPALLATVTQERGIMQLGKRYAAYNLAFLAAVVVAYSLFAYFLLRTRVLARIESLGRQLRRFDPRAEVSLRMKMSGDDEIAELAGNVNAMLCKIDDSRREIKEQHRRIEENERFLNQLFNSIKAGIMLVDAEKRTIVDINDFALRMIGREYRDVVGRVCHKFTSPSEAGHCPILDLHKEQDFSTRQLITADHGLIPIMKSVAFVEKDGRRLLLETFIDISELEQMRRQVEQARDELEQKVQERTKELAEANRELQVLDQARTLFLSSASHELRTPLTSVMGFLKLMERSFSKHFAPILEAHPDVQPRVRQHLDNLAVVRGEATRLGRLVNDLLDLNKIESGRMQWRDVPVTVQELLHDARALAAGLLEARPGVTVVVDIQPDLPRLCVDRDRIHQVLNNLVSNAVKFTDQGRIVLAARASDTLVEISVHDTGSGIPASDHQHIFDLFYQSQDYDNRSANPLGTGTGLGLAISRNIVQHYRGEIWVESEPGKGSTFFFTLPVV
jgi:PAS domain S-box-containing protein